MKSEATGICGADGAATIARLRAALVRRDRILRDLQESEAQYRAMFDMAGEAMFLIDAHSLQIIDANRAAEALYGYSRTELLTLRNVDLSAEPESTAHAVDDRLPLVLVRRHRKKDGTVFPVEIAGSYFRCRGRDCHIAMVRDITERVRLEDRREDVERIIRHELRSPIASLMHLYMLLDRTSSPEEQRELIASAQETTQRMLDVVTLHQELYEIETGAYRAALEPVDLAATVEDVTAELRGRAALAEVRFEVVCEGMPSAPSGFFVAGHKALCRMAVANLMRNALDASPRGGVVTVRLGHTPAGPELAIHNALPVPAEIRERFFEKYVTSGKAGGTGLGAYTAKLIADAIGRGIAMRTADDAGTLITIRFKG